MSVVNATDSSAISARILIACASAGLHREGLAKAAGVSQRVVRYWERGERRPNAGSLEAIARATGCSLGWLVSGEGSAITSPNTEKEETNEREHH